MRPDGKTLEAFGYEAENKYAELAEEKLHGNYYYFKKFKMLLHEKLVFTIKIQKFGHLKKTVIILKFEVWFHHAVLCL